MFPVVPAPAFPAGYAATTPAHLRYEDLTQDGRLIPIAAPAGLAGLWREVLGKHPGARNALQLGIIPILTRLTIHSTDTATRVDRPVETRNGFALAHDKTGDDITRLFMLVWCEIHGSSGLAGTVFAEHTFTKPFAPPDQRRVTTLAVDGFPAVPELHYPQPAASTAGELPDGARWLDELAPDDAEYVFTLDQTDSNQHVNSLVYIRMFCESVNRRLAATGRALRARTKAVDIAYRKPCFAGDKVRAYLRLYEGPHGLGAAGHVLGDDGKPRCYVRVAVGA